jgi:hypothetical protein
MLCVWCVCGVCVVCVWCVCGVCVVCVWSVCGANKLKAKEPKPPHDGRRAEAPTMTAEPPDYHHGGDPPLIIGLTRFVPALFNRFHFANEQPTDPPPMKPRAPPAAALTTPSASVALSSRTCYAAIVLRGWSQTKGTRAAVHSPRLAQTAASDHICNER